MVGWKSTDVTPSGEEPRKCHSASMVSIESGPVAPFIFFSFFFRFRLHCCFLFTFFSFSVAPVFRGLCLLLLCRVSQTSNEENQCTTIKSKNDTQKLASK